jgi:hypothetical protein
MDSKLIDMRRKERVCLDFESEKHVGIGFGVDSTTASMKAALVMVLNLNRMSIYTFLRNGVNDQHYTFLLPTVLGLEVTKCPLSSSSKSLERLSCLSNSTKASNLLLRPFQAPTLPGPIMFTVRLENAQHP